RYVRGGSGYGFAMRLADELLLLAYSEKGTSQLSQYSLDLGLGGAVLLELALAERFDVRDGKIVVVDPGPVGDPGPRRRADPRRQRQEGPQPARLGPEARRPPA